ncbi:MAG: hypothetical protein B5M53_09055 [Candidatus Cloacimonas sp. 4484_209]|nr:MAG: hypothetical protein B5M53_09055 [Candidatus Cloacimonas sp. 4484_209]
MLRKLVRYSYTILLAGLNFLEGNLLSKSKPKYPVIFIIGPPRSGTTLLYQLMTHYFHMAYFFSMSDLFFTAPVLMSKIFKPLLRPYQSDFQSNYGKVRGFNSPQEGRIWRRWFPTDWNASYHYVGPSYLSTQEKMEIRATIANIEKIYNAPFINKNVYNSVRIRALVDIFPSSLFLQLKRDPIQIALSILEGRKKSKDINQWWSVMPREINQLRYKSHIEQIAGQVYYIEKNIEEDMEIVGVDRFYIVSYKRLCKAPQAELQSIKLFLTSKGVPLRTKYDIPTSFRYYRVDESIFTEEQYALAEQVKAYYRS